LLDLQKLIKKTWSAAPILGHTKSNPIYRITLAKGLELCRNGFTCVAQLFGVDELTGKIDKNCEGEAGVR